MERCNQTLKSIDLQSKLKSTTFSAVSHLLFHSKVWRWTHEINRKTGTFTKVENKSILGQSKDRQEMPQLRLAYLR